MEKTKSNEKNIEFLSQKDPRYQPEFNESIIFLIFNNISKLVLFTNLAFITVIFKIHKFSENIFWRVISTFNVSKYTGILKLNQ